MLASLDSIEVKAVTRRSSTAVDAATGRFLGVVIKMVCIDSEKRHIPHAGAIVEYGMAIALCGLQDGCHLRIV